MMCTLPNRQVNYTIPELKARLDHLDRAINILRAERAQLGFKFDTMLRENAKPSSAPQHDVQQAQWYDHLVGGTGFEHSPVRNAR